MNCPQCESSQVVLHPEETGRADCYACHYFWYRDDAAKFKVIDTDNFARDSVADVLVADGFETEAEARARADQQNEGRGERSDYWAIAVPAGHRLSRGMEDLV